MSDDDYSGATGQEPAIPKLLLTSKEASIALGISEKTLWNLTKAGIIPAVRIGRLVRYDPEDLKKFIHKRKEAG
jgi:excisionase family DNA binding protein